MVWVQERGAEVDADLEVEEETLRVTDMVPVPTAL
jgi:hypothetical protein